MSQVKNFCVTVNNWTDVMLDALKGLNIITYGIFGEEVGESGTPHLQGYIQLDTRHRIMSLQNKFRQVGILAHVEVALGSPEQNIRYCSKEQEETSDTLHEWGDVTSKGQRKDLEYVRDLIETGASAADIRAELPGQWYRYNRGMSIHIQEVAQNKMEEAVRNEMNGVVLREWQVIALERLEAQTERTVTWVVDPKGNKGKSWLSKYLYARRGAFEVSNGKTKDIAYAYRGQQYVVFDYTRQKQEWVNYDIIESFKNGKIFSPKYESKSIRFQWARVLVLSNWEPNQSMLSRDRWDIMRISIASPIEGMIYID